MTLSKLGLFFTLNCRHKHYKSDSIIFSYGDLADTLFLLLKGKVTIFIPFKEEYNLKADEYFKELGLIYDSTPDLLRLNINSNYEMFPIDSSHASILKQIGFYFMFKKLIKRQQYNKIKNLLLDYKINQQSIGLKSFDFYSYDEGAMSDLIRNVAFLLFQDVKINLKKYFYLEKELVAKVYIYKYRESEVYSKKGDFFGDTGFENDYAKSLCTCSEDSDFLVVNKEIYQEVILKEKQKIRKKEISFLLGNFFFHSVKQALFEKQFFSFFTLNNYHIGDILVKNGNQLEFLHFIKEGKIELTMTHSLLSLQHLLKSLSEKEGVTDNQNNFNMYDFGKQFT